MGDAGLTPPGATPWLSVVTVVKDDPSGFACTLDSLAQQDRTGVEYLVIDGSTDQTAIPAALAARPEIDASYAWQEPRGIYQAMNAGLAQASGTYIYFANAGDAFHHPDVLGSVRGALAARAPIWAFGPVEIHQVNGQRVRTPAWDFARERRSCFSHGLFPPHQGTFARRTALLEFGGFDASYTIAADYAAFLRLSLQGDPLVLEAVIATFVEGGVSTLRWQESFAQFHRARQEILKPQGAASLRERWGTSTHFARVFVYRELVQRMRHRVKP